MEFGKILLIDYALSVFTEIYQTDSKSKLSYNLFLKDSDDIFSCNIISLEGVNPVFYSLSKNNNDIDMVKQETYFVANKNIFNKVRIELFNHFSITGKDYHIQQPLINNPELLLEFLINLIEEISIDFNTKSKTIVFNYRSRLSNLELPFKYVSDDLDIVSLEFILPLEQN